MKTKNLQDLSEEISRLNEYLYSFHFEYAQNLILRILTRIIIDVVQDFEKRYEIIPTKCLPVSL